MLKSLVAAVALTAAAGLAVAEDYEVGDLTVSQPWSRATPAGAKVGAGYLTIANRGSEPDRLVGAEAPFAGRVEVHEMAMDEGVMKMRELPDGLTVEPGATVALEPGGYHLMFMELKEPLAEGETVPVILSFERAGPLELEFPVEAIGAKAPGGHGSH